MLRIAVPNKGRLAESALALLERAGLAAQPRADRALVASLGDQLQAIFLRASDIPEFVADGAAELGVTGADRISESGRAVRELLDLGFGQCRMVVAVRDESPLTAAADLEPGTRVATSFPRIAERFFGELGLGIEIAPVSGAAEIAPHLGVADVIVDLTSTGSTLRVNGLRELETVMDSTARLIGNDEAVVDPAMRPEIDELVGALESVLRAAEKRYLMANVPREALEDVRRVIPGISGPTIVEIMDGGPWLAAHAVVDAANLYQTIAKLKTLGAEGILVTRIERLMP